MRINNGNKKYHLRRFTWKSYRKLRNKKTFKDLKEILEQSGVEVNKKDKDINTLNLHRPK